METDPVLGADFFGREDILQSLDKRLQAFLKGYRQNVGLIGSKSSGRSSLVQYFLSTLKDPTLIAVYAEVIPEPFDYFAQKFMGSLLASFLNNRQEDTAGAFSGLVSKSRHLIPKTLGRMRAVKKKLATEDWDTAFRELLALTQILGQESGKKVLLVLDNFDRLDDLLLKNPFHDFGNAMMSQTETLYVVTSGRKRRAREIFQKDLSLLFGNFEILEVKPFDFLTSQAFLDKKLEGLSASAAMKKFLSDLTDGQPYFLSVLAGRCRALSAAGETSLTEDTLLTALEKELFDRRGELHRYFAMVLQSLGQGRALFTALKVLMAVSMGYRKNHQIARFLNRRVDDIKKTLSRLLEEEFLEKKGSFFKLTSPLFGFWLRYVYYRREFAFAGPHEHTVAAFRQEVRDLIKQKAEEDGKEITKRVEELFRQFQNDVVELEAKKIRCPHFNEVHSKPSNGRVFPVEAKAADTRWLCQVAYRKVTEDDVRLFIQDIEKLRKKVQRKIMITLEGIELNAKLLAKESKILLWPLKEFNELLELYGRPKVIA